MHKNAINLKRKAIVKQVKEKEKSVHDFKAYIPIENAIEKIKTWRKLGAIIFYLTSRKERKEISDIKKVLKKIQFSQRKIII